MRKYIMLFLLVSSVGFAQNLNQYKYALVPSRFKFLKENNQYNLNTLSKLFMEKYGFETYMDTDTFPTEFANDNCNKVFVDLVESNTMFMTKIKVILKDCKNTVLYTSEEGTSREKEYKTAYNQALRAAFKSMESLNHHYDGSVVKVVEAVPAEVKPQVKSELKTETVAVENEVVSNSGQLYAQPIANGFQLINTVPEVVYKIYKTSTKDFYIGSKVNNSGVFFLRNNEWFFEYYQNEKLISEKVAVKF